MRKILIMLLSSALIAGCGREVLDRGKLYTTQLSGENKETLETRIKSVGIAGQRGNEYQIAKIYEELAKTIEESAGFQRPDWPQIAKSQFEALKIYNTLIQGNGPQAQESQNAINNIELDAMLYCADKGSVFQLGKYVLTITGYKPTFGTDETTQKSAIIVYSISQDGIQIKTGTVGLSRGNYTLLGLLGDKA